MATREFPALGFDPAPGDAGRGLRRGVRRRTAPARCSRTRPANVSRLNSSGLDRGRRRRLPRPAQGPAAGPRPGRPARTGRPRRRCRLGHGLAGRQRRAAELESRAADLRRQEQSAVGRGQPAGRADGPVGQRRARPAQGPVRHGPLARRGSVSSQLQDGHRARPAGCTTSTASAALGAAPAGSTTSPTRRTRSRAGCPGPGTRSRAGSPSTPTCWPRSRPSSRACRPCSACCRWCPGLQFLAPFAVAAGGDRAGHRRGDQAGHRQGVVGVDRHRRGADVPARREDPGRAQGRQGGGRRRARAGRGGAGAGRRREAARRGRGPGRGGRRRAQGQPDHGPRLHRGAPGQRQQQGGPAAVPGAGRDQPVLPADQGDRRRPPERRPAGASGTTARAACRRWTSSWPGW